MPRASSERTISGSDRRMRRIAGAVRVVAAGARQALAYRRSGPLVAGEAEEVPSVVHELVDRRPADQRERAFLGPDEVDQHEQQRPGEQDVGLQLMPRDDRRWAAALDADIGHAEYLLGITRPVVDRRLRGGG